MNTRHLDTVQFYRYRLDLTRILIVFVLALFASSAQAAPKAKLWERWTAHDATSKAAIDHAPWDRFLKTYLTPGKDGINRIAYQKVSSADREALGGYIKRLSATRISTYSRPVQQAYWINLYNALTIKVVLDNYPFESILKLNISPGFFSIGPWGKKLTKVEGQDITLDDIEHRILRPIWRDPRIHYAVNCASLGCPNLQQDAFTAANTETLLTKGAREYINHPRGVTFERGELFVSSIYKWFKDDFGGTDEGVIAHLKQYAEPKLAARLAKVDEVDGHNYDWSLNETRPSS